MPNINKILFKLEVFQYAMSLDLNMGYCPIRLRKITSILCTIIFLWGGYCYKGLPMGITNYPDILLQKIIYLFHGIEFIREYINDLLI